MAVKIKSVQVHVRVTKEMNREMKRVAKENNMTRAQWVREAIAFTLKPEKTYPFSVE